MTEKSSCKIRGFHSIQIQLSEAERKLEFNPQKSTASMMNLIINKVKNVYNKEVKNEKNKMKKEMTEHNHKVREIVKRLDRAITEEAVQEAKNDPKEENHVSYLRRNEIRFRERIDHFYRNENGKMTDITFKTQKKKNLN